MYQPYNLHTVSFQLRAAPEVLVFMVTFTTLINPQTSQFVCGLSQGVVDVSSTVVMHRVVSVLTCVENQYKTFHITPVYL